MSELVRLVTSLDFGKLEWCLDVDSEDAATAYVLMIKIMRLGKIDKLAKQTESKISHLDFMKHLDEKTKLLIVEKLRNLHRELASGLEEEVNTFLRHVLRKYPWLRYAAFIPVFTKYSLLALVFDPPEVVYKRGIRPRSWVEYFIPHTAKRRVRKGRQEVEVEVIHKPLAARFFYTYTRLKAGLRVVSISRVRSLVEKMHGCDRLVQWVDQQFGKAYGKYQNRARAAAVTFRDLVRICLSNVYLVYSYLAHRAGKIQAVMLPYELAKMPLNATSYFNPVDIVYKTYVKTCSRYVGVDISEISWTWTIQRLIESWHVHQLQNREQS